MILSFLEVLKHTVVKKDLCPAHLFFKLSSRGVIHHVSPYQIHKSSNNN
jgi:hypothetical protein